MIILKMLLTPGMNFQCRNGNIIYIVHLSHKSDPLNCYLLDIMSNFETDYCVGFLHVLLIFFGILISFSISTIDTTPPSDWCADSNKDQRNICKISEITKESNTTICFEVGYYTIPKRWWFKRTDLWNRGSLYTYSHFYIEIHSRCQ